VEGTPYREAQMCLGPRWANSYYLFSVSGGNTLTNIYTNGTLTTPFANTGRATADAYGRFQPIYLDPSIIYRVRFFNSAGVQQWQVDPYTSTLSTVGTSSLSAFGFQIAPTGEFTLDAPNTGGSGVTLTVNAGVLGTAALKITGTLAGNSAIIINSSATTGTQTATFAATNKPGPNITNTLLATVAPTGAAYVGGTLTANYPGATTSSAVIVLSTGQIISGATFTAGSATFTTPSTSITGTPTTTLLVTGPQASSPAGWLPITCDGVQYYTPIWHDNNFTPYAPNPTAVGEIIVASSVTFGGNGLTSVVGGTATPGNWFSPTTVGIGAGYYIKITKTSGLSGVQFSAANGSYANITSGGLTITSNAQATITGTYTLSSSVSGSPIVAAGTITLSNNNGVQSPTYNGVTPVNFDGDGTATVNGVASSNWYAPTTASIGASYYLLITQTGGTAGYSFSAGTGTPVLISSGGISIGITGTGTPTNFVTGTYQISSDSAGAVVLGSGTITINGSPVQSPNYSGAAPLVLAGNGTATVGGTSAGNWYSPTTSNVGSGYWIDITRTSGQSGVNFSAAQGSWTNITNSGLSVGLTGYSGTYVGTVTVGGTYNISSSSGGTPVLGTGTISLSVSGLTVLHVYTTHTTAVETAPSGSSQVTVELFGAGSGGGGSSNNNGGGGGGGPGYCRSNISISGGQTLNYTLASGGAGGAGAAVTASNGTAASGPSTVTSGTATITTMTANIGAVGHGANGSSPGAGGAGGTATGGTQANTTGTTGATGTTLGSIADGGTTPFGVNASNVQTSGGNGAYYFANIPENGYAGSDGAAIFYYQ
jgi:hypothetical protein